MLHPSHTGGHIILGLGVLLMLLAIWNAQTIRIPALIHAGLCVISGWCILIGLALSLRF